MSDAPSRAAAVDDTPADTEPAVTVETRGQVLLVGLNRPTKFNAFNLDTGRRDQGRLMSRSMLQARIPTRLEAVAPPSCWSRFPC